MSYRYTKLEKPEQAATVARVLANGEIVGFFSGRLEFGPRALGSRSMLGDPRREDTQRVMNLKIKYRESFRPFAPSVLIEDSNSYFELDYPSPYMLLVAPVRKERCLPRDVHISDDDYDLMVAVNQKRSDIPSVTHWNYSARIQTVHRETNPRYHEVISAFKEITGYGVIVNTSFNVRGEPIICTPEDAYRCFMRTEMDYLFMEGFWLDKKCQPKIDKVDNWRDEYALD